MIGGGLILMLWPLWNESPPSTGPKIGALFLLLMLSVWFHEMGHAIAGWVVGHHIELISWGGGPVAFSFRIRGTEVQTRTVGLTGRVFGFPRDGRETRWRELVFTMGGLVANAALLGIGWATWPAENASTSGWTKSGIAPSLVLANALTILRNLLPTRGNSELGPAPSDGLRMLEIAFGRRLTFFWDSPIGGAKWHAAAARILSAIMALVALGCAALGVFSIRSLIRVPPPKPGLLAGTAIIFALGAGAGYMAARLWWRTALPVQPSDLDPMAQAGRALFDDATRVGDALNPTALNIILVQMATQTEQGGPEAALLRLRKPDVPPNNVLVNHYVSELSRGLQRWDEAKAAAENALSVPGLTESSRVLLYWDLISAGVEFEPPDAVRQYAHRALAGFETPSVRTFFLDLLCGLVVFQQRLEFLPDADMWSKQALSLSDSPTLKGTRAAILFELGRTDEAEPLLQEVLAASRETIDQGLSHLYLALIAQRRGNSKQARRLAWIAWNNYPIPVISTRLAAAGIYVPGQERPR